MSRIKSMNSINGINRLAAWLMCLVLAVALLAGCAGTGGSQSGAASNITESAGSVETQAAVEEQGSIEGGIEEQSSIEGGIEEQGDIKEHGSYDTKDTVALYIHIYGHLPDNYLTKKDAEALGWDSKKGNLWEVAPGKSIGGSRFGNYEGQLPEKEGRKYFECDLEYDGGYRGTKRLVYSDDGLIFYTEDHYKTFEQLY